MHALVARGVVDREPEHPQVRRHADVGDAAELLAHGRADELGQRLVVPRRLHEHAQRLVGEPEAPGQPVDVALQLGHGPHGAVGDLGLGLEDLEDPAAGEADDQGRDDRGQPRQREAAAPGQLRDGDVEDEAQQGTDERRLDEPAVRQPPPADGRALRRWAA